jgi:hypothetical protein
MRGLWRKFGNEPQIFADLRRLKTTAFIAEFAEEFFENAEKTVRLMEIAEPPYLRRHRRCPLVCDWGVAAGIQ